MDASSNKLVEGVAQELCADELSIPWAQVPEPRRTVYRVRARQHLRLVFDQLDVTGWTLVPTKLDEAEALEVTLKTVMRAPRAMKEAEEFVLSPQIVQAVLDQIIRLTTPLSAEKREAG